MSWTGYVDGVLRPMREAKSRSIAERACVIKTLRIAADWIEGGKIMDPVAWLRAEADKLEKETDDGK